VSSETFPTRLWRLYRLDPQRMGGETVPTRFWRLYRLGPQGMGGETFAIRLGWLNGIGSDLGRFN
jgi:hypothetical protein